MIKSIAGWFRGLFAPRTKAQGLSSEPTYSQVERLIAAAGGASAQGGSLYSKPTYSQVERLIAALGGGSGSGSGSGSGLPAKRDKLDLGVYDFMPETWEVSGPSPLYSEGTYTWDGSSQWVNNNGQRAIRAKAGAPNTYQLVFDPGKAGELTVCEWEGTLAYDVPFTHNGEPHAVTVEGRGNAGLKPTGDTLAKKSAVDAKRAKDDLSTYSYPSTPGYWTSNGDTFSPVDGEFPDSNGVYIWANDNNRIQYNPKNGNIFRAFAPTAIVTTSKGLDPSEPEDDFGTLQLGTDGRSFSYTVAVRGDSLEKDEDSLARKSYVDAAVAGTVDNAGYDAKYGNEQKPTILLKHGNRVVATVDASAFIVDGMVEDVYIGDATSGPEGTPDEDESGKLVVKFNTDAGSKVLRIPLTAIFNPDNFVEKGATNILIGSGASKVNNVTNAVVIGVNASANGSATSSAVAIGTGAKAKKTGAIQLGAGENTEEKSLRFRDTTVVGGDGKIPVSNLDKDVRDKTDMAVYELRDTPSYWKLTVGSSVYQLDPVEGSFPTTDGADGKYVWRRTDTTDTSWRVEYTPSTGDLYYPRDMKHASAAAGLAPSSPTADFGTVSIGSGSFQYHPVVRKAVETGDSLARDSEVAKIPVYDGQNHDFLAATSLVQGEDFTTVTTGALHRWTMPHRGIVYIRLVSTSSSSTVRVGVNVAAGASDVDDAHCVTSLSKFKNETSVVVPLFLNEGDEVCMSVLSSPLQYVLFSCFYTD